VGSGSVAKDLIIQVCYESLTASNREIIKLHILVWNYSNFTAVMIGDFNHGDIYWQRLQN